MILFLLATGLPLAQLLGAPKTWAELPKALAAGQQALWHSFAFAASAATICVALGLMTWRRPWGAVLWLPFFIPGVLLGMALIFVLNRPLFSAVYQSAAIVVLGLTLRYVAVAWHGVAHALRSTDRDLADAARLEGASGWQLLRHVEWPQIASPLAVAWYVTYVLCRWDVETLVLIVPPGGETAALRIFNLLHYGHTAQVNALCLLLLFLALLPWILWQTGRGVHMFRRLLEFFQARTLFTASTLPSGRLFGNGFNRRDAKDAETNVLVISAFFASLRFAMSWPWIGAPRHWKKACLAGTMAVGVGLALAGCSPPASSEAKLESAFFSRAQVIGSRGAGPASLASRGL